MDKKKKVKAVEPAAEKKEIVFHNKDTAPIGQGIPPEESLPLNNEKTPDLESNYRLPWRKEIYESLPTEKEVFTTLNWHFIKYLKSNNNNLAHYLLLSVEQGILPTTMLVTLKKYGNADDLQVGDVISFEMSTITGEYLHDMRQSYYILENTEKGYVVAPVVSPSHYMPLVPDLMALKNGIAIDVPLKVKLGDKISNIKGGLPYIQMPSIPEVYGITNTEEDAIEQQNAAGIPYLKEDELMSINEPGQVDLKFSLDDASTEELILAISRKQTNPIKQRKVMRLLKEKLE